jgi:2,4-dienoyl-CoA reductase-like NADH-dependent reductase (Old Yellow Enzyme family)
MGHGADLVGVARAAVGHADWASHIHEPEYEPERPPFTPQHLREQGLSNTFVEYMRNWKGFVE